MRGALICLVVVFAVECEVPTSEAAFLASNISSTTTDSSSDYNIGASGTTGSGTPYTNEVAAQEFTAALGGQVGQINVTGDAFNNPASPLLVSLFTASGTNLGNLLGSVAVPASSISSSPNYPNFSGLITADFTSQNITLVAGMQYFVELTTATPSSTRFYRAFLLSTSNPQAFGYRAQSGLNGPSSLAPGPIANEIGLAVNSAVPEPSSALLLALGLVAVCQVARRRTAS